MSAIYITTLSNDKKIGVNFPYTSTGKLLGDLGGLEFFCGVFGCDQVEFLCGDRS